MKQLKTTPPVLALAVLSLWVAGCASPNVNPPEARAHTGYVDFHADPTNELCWHVTRFEQRTQSFKDVFLEYGPVQGAILRLTFAPGHYRIRITFLNRLIANPAEVEVEVQNGKVTPVRVTLIETSTTMVQTKEVSRGGTVYGRYGRRTKIGNDEAVMYAISALAEPPVDYQPKERMPYAR
jgi:hypothetical protein